MESNEKNGDYDRIRLIGPFMCPPCLQAYWHGKAQCKGSGREMHEAVYVVETDTSGLRPNTYVLPHYPLVIGGGDDRPHRQRLEDSRSGQGSDRPRRRRQAARHDTVR